MICLVPIPWFPKLTFSFPLVQRRCASQAILIHSRILEDCRLWIHNAWLKLRENMSNFVSHPCADKHQPNVGTCIIHGSMGMADPCTCSFRTVEEIASKTWLRLHTYRKHNSTRWPSTSYEQGYNSTYRGYKLGLPPTQDSSHKWRFSSGFPTKNGMSSRWWLASWVGGSSKL